MKVCVRLAAIGIFVLSIMHICGCSVANIVSSGVIVQTRLQDRSELSEIITNEDQLNSYLGRACYFVPDDVTKRLSRLLSNSNIVVVQLANNYRKIRMQSALVREGVLEFKYYLEEDPNYVSNFPECSYLFLEVSKVVKSVSAIRVTSPDNSRAP
jgi:hypothetical protein